MLGTSYVLENDRIFKETLQQAGEIVSDLRVPFGLIGRDFYRSQKAIFGLKGPGQYPPFKNSVRAQGLEKGKDGKLKRGVEFNVSRSRYQDEKIKDVGFDYPLLVRSGKLAASVLAPNASGSIYQVTPLSLAIGTSIEYGIYHQSDAPRKKIPLRKFIFIGPEAPRFANSDQMGRLERWVKIIEDYAIRSYIKKGFT